MLEGDNMFLDPFDELERMHREMDRLFSGFGARPLIGYGKNKGKELAKWFDFRPAMSDCYETENSVIASFELPGANKDDIELNVTNDHIEVKIEKKAETKKEDKEKGYYAYEARASQFYKRIPLPADVDADKAKAEYKNGMLRVEIPKKQEAKKEKKRKIEIK